MSETEMGMTSLYFPKSLSLPFLKVGYILFSSSKNFFYLATLLLVQHLRKKKHYLCITMNICWDRKGKTEHLLLQSINKKLRRIYCSTDIKTLDSGCLAKIAQDSTHTASSLTHTVAKLLLTTELSSGNAILYQSKHVNITNEVISNQIEAWGAQVLLLNTQLSWLRICSAAEQTKRNAYSRTL